MEGAKSAVISVHAKHAVDVGELNVGGPPDHFDDPSVGSRGKPPGRRRVSTSEGSGFFISFVRALLAAKADVNVYAANGETAMSLATAGGLAEIVQLLKPLPPR